MSATVLDCPEVFEQPTLLEAPTAQEVVRQLLTSLVPVQTGVKVPNMQDVVEVITLMDDDETLDLWSARDCLGAKVMQALNPTATSVHHLWTGGELCLDGKMRNYDFCDDRNVFYFFERLSEWTIYVRAGKQELLHVAEAFM